jgi:membrane-bound inhibitor of C-type lysozyme
MHDQIVRQWASIRSYLVRDGHLFVSLVADGGIYEFGPLATAAAAPAVKSPVTTRGPVSFSCGTGDAVRATFYQTKPALVLLERGGVFKLAFRVKAASGTRYEGDGLLFWEARGQATLNWMGAESICTRN